MFIASLWLLDMNELSVMLDKQSLPETLANPFQVDRESTLFWGGEGWCK